MLWRNPHIHAAKAGLANLGDCRVQKMIANFRSCSAWIARSRPAKTSKAGGAQGAGGMPMGR